MLRKIDPRTKLGRRLLTIGTYYQNQSSSKSGRVSKLMRADNTFLQIGVTAKGTLSITFSGELKGKHTVIELLYGNLTVEQYVGDVLRYVSDAAAIKVLNDLLKREFKHVPSKVTREQHLHIN